MLLTQYPISTMEYHHHHKFLYAFFLLLSSLRSVFSNSGAIGINYGRIANDLPPPQQVIKLLKAQGITKVKLFDTDAAVLSALAHSAISVVIALPNEQLSSAASNQSFTDSWVQSNVLRYHPNTIIDAIAIGNEVFVDPQNTTPFLVPAMNNVYASLVKYDVASSIKVSSPIALSALQTSYPPSSGSFKPDLVEPVIKPMLKFLKKTGSYLMVNSYPFFAYVANKDTISLDYALLGKNSGNVDSKNGLLYKSLFDAQLDAVYSAMNALGFNDVEVVVSETGWPSKGDENEVGASEENAAAYNGNLVRRVLTGDGTPLRPDEPLTVYLFALFNENEKPGPTSERNYGLFYPNQKKVYDIPLGESKSQVAAAAPSPGWGGGGGGTVTRLGEVSASKVGQTWCVANGQAGVEKLQEALDYACGEGGADCRPIQAGSTCYDPNTIEAHASYAFNSYYQRYGRGSGTCNFGGAAYVVTQPPKFGTCAFPTSD